MNPNTVPPETPYGVSAEEYGPCHRAHTLEIYKTCVEMADRISARRERANSFFLTINAVLLGLLAHGGLSDVARWVVPVFGVIFCLVWRQMIQSYRALNREKFTIIHAIERHLPLRPYHAEWAAIKGKEGRADSYVQFTSLEGKAPEALIFLHGILFVFFFVKFPLVAVWEYLSCLC